MNYTQQSHGDYLVLVHGALTDGTMWDDHIEDLASDFDVIAVTLRHFGQTETGSFGLNTHAEELTELLGELTQQKSVHIVAWSYGADVVLNALAQQDLPISSVFLYEPGYPGCLQEPALSAWQQDANAMFEPVFEHFSNQQLDLAVESLIDGSGNQKGYFHSQSNAVKERQLAQSHTLAHQLHQQEKPAIDTVGLSSIKVPVILGYGQDTRDVFKLVTTRAAQLIPHAQLTDISGENHMLPQAKPHTFSTHIKALLLSRKEYSA
ncbi:alpha/beta fold hydrolase [Vibrio ostreicida]|uniref:alpha/beta fold hydrolase n=1 Tax=Vibrio ostreicida TaxID=526588 RepID=UPI003B5BE670